MDIRVLVKKAYEKVSNEIQSAWQKTSYGLKNTFVYMGDKVHVTWGKTSSWMAEKSSKLPKWTNVQIGGLVIMVVCLGLLGHVLQKKYSVRHDYQAQNMLDAHVTSTIEKVKKLQEKVHALEQQSQRQTNHVSGKNDVSMPDAHTNPTNPAMETLKKLEKKVKVLEQQSDLLTNHVLEKGEGAVPDEQEQTPKTSTVATLKKLEKKVNVLEQQSNLLTSQVLDKGERAGKQKQPAKTPSIEMMKKLAEKVNALEQQSNLLTSHVLENGERAVLDEQKQTPKTETIEMVKKLADKVDALEQKQQQAAYVGAIIKKEVQSQVAQRDHDIKNKKLQVLRKLVQEVDGDK